MMTTQEIVGYACFKDVENNHTSRAVRLSINSIKKVSQITGAVPIQYSNDISTNSQCKRNIRTTLINNNKVKSDILTTKEDKCCISCPLLSFKKNRIKREKDAQVQRISQIQSKPLPRLPIEIPSSPKYSLQERRKIDKISVVPIQYQQSLQSNSFDDVIAYGFLVDGKHHPTIHLSLTPEQLRLDSCSPKFLRYYGSPC